VFYSSQIINNTPTERTGVNITEVTNMKLTSPVFKNNESMPSIHTCDGNDSSPPLTISDVPSNTNSLVLIMDDPDAIKPAGKVWDHWIVFNIPPETTEIPAGKEPIGVHGRGTSNNLRYHGPCPPDGEHRYYFKLYALDIILNLPEGSSKNQVELAMKGYILATAEFMGRYNRRH